MILPTTFRKIFPAVVYLTMISLIVSGLGFVFLFNVPVAEAQPHIAEGDVWGLGQAGGAPTVYAIAHSGNTVYVGGGFSYVGPYTGRGVIFDGSGNLKTDSAFVGGGGLGGTTVEVSAPDGSGGWYIAGGFAQVGGVARAGLAHILSDGTLDSSWNPAPDNAVSAIAISGSDIYVGGGFLNIGGQARVGLAKLNNTNGDADLSWDPHPTSFGFDGQVRRIAISGSDIYVSGNFDNIGGQALNYLARLNNTNGNADPTWAPNPSGMMGAQIETMVIDGSTIYVGGSFDTIFDFRGGQSRNNIAAINTSTGLVIDGWDPNADRDVRAIAVSGSSIYVGGQFENIGGQARNYLAVLDTSGNATSWDPNPISYVFTISMSNSNIYVGGEFDYIGGVTRNNLAAINITTGRPTSWNPASDFPVKSMVLDGSTLYVGGVFTQIGGAARNRIAAIDTGTGLATAWDPSATGGFNGVLALALSGSNVYAGGDFTTIGGQPRNRIAALDTGTGLATAWDPNADNSIATITINGSNVYAGGSFSNIGGQARNRIAAIDITTGNATAWDPNASGGGGFPATKISALAVSGSNVYAGGDFTTIGGQARNRIAAIDITTGNATAWNPNSGGKVYSLAVDGSTVYVGGHFASIGGQARTSLASIDAGTGLANSWDPNTITDCGACMMVPPFIGDGNAIAVGSPVLVGGAFFTPTSGGSVRGFAEFGSSPKMSDTLTRLKVSTLANHTIELTLGEGVNWDTGDTLTLTLQSDFDLTALSSADPLDYDINTGVEETIVAAGGCGASDAIEITSIAGQVITFTACGSYTPPGTNATIVIQIGTNATTGGAGDSQITNPTVAGSYTVDFAGTIGDSNSCMVAIVDDDSVIITATVDPTFTFIISSPTCALGALDTVSVKTCNYYLAVGTNATGGAKITIQAISDGTNAKLNSDANPADDVDDIVDDSLVTTGAEGYGISLAGGAVWTEVNNVGFNFAVDDTPIPSALKEILSVTGPVADTVANRSTVTHRAAISPTSPAGLYSQTIQYIATGTF